MRRLINIILIAMIIAQTFAFSACSNENDEANGTQNETSESSNDSGSAGVIPPEAPADDFEYEEIKGGIKITKYLGDDKQVVIPKLIENKKVTSVSDTVFSGNVVIEAIYFPENMETTFDWSVLSGCDSLSKIAFLGDVEYFAKTSKLEALKTIDFKSVAFRIFHRLTNNIISYAPNIETINIGEVKGFDLASIGKYGDYTGSSTALNNININIPEDIENRILSASAKNTLFVVSEDYYDWSEGYRLSRAYYLGEEPVVGSSSPIISGDDYGFSSPTISVAATYDKYTDFKETTVPDWFYALSKNELEAIGFTNIDIKPYDAVNSETGGSACLFKGTVTFEGKEHQFQSVMQGSYKIVEDDYEFDREILGLDVTFEEYVEVYFDKVNDSITLTENLPNNANMCITFGSGNITVNGKAYSCDF